MYYNVRIKYIIFTYSICIVDFLIFSFCEETCAHRLEIVLWCLRHGVEYYNGLSNRIIGIQCKLEHIYNCFRKKELLHILSSIFSYQDVMDELADIREKKRKATLEQRRSFFVRMVSDPAIQPGFTKTPNRTGTKLDTQATIGGIGSNTQYGA